MFLGAKPLTNPESKSIVSYLIDMMFSIAWVSATSLMLVGFFFGSMIVTNTNGISEDITDRFIQILDQAMLDYQCVGSRVWLFIVAMLLPSLLTLIKIMTN